MNTVQYFFKIAANPAIAVLQRFKLFYYAVNCITHIFVAVLEY
jgi:hypothetical protein